MSTSIATEPTAVAIPEEHRDTAGRYIEAIARHDPLAYLGPDYLAIRMSELWDVFIANYTSVAMGPYARHGRDAIRIALGRL